VRTVPVWKDSVSLWTHEIEYLRSHGGEDRLAGVIAHYNLAKAYDAASLLPSAAEEYSRVLAINPRYLDAYVNRGVIYARLGKFGLAIEDFSRAISIDPRATAAYYNRALAYGETGEMERARKDMESARRLGWGR
jgi:tetratricopeptide (TPR) repeat protein